MSNSCVRTKTSIQSLTQCPALFMEVLRMFSVFNFFSSWVIIVFGINAEFREFRFSC
jgi:hypothetical protein